MALTVAIAPALAACGSSSSGGERAIDRDLIDVAKLPADQIIWQVFSGGGFVPYAVFVAQVPSLTIYGDGTVLQADYENRDRYDHPVAIRTSMLSPEELAAFMATVEGSGLIDADLEFGDPQVTDLPSTSVTFHGTEAARVVDVYALDYDDAGGGLSSAERKRRSDLSDLIESSHDLVDDTEPWTPDQVAAIEVTDEYGDPDAEPADWPAAPFVELYADETPSRTNCAVIEGPDADVVLQAAIDNPGIEFTDGTETPSVVVRSVLPGHPTCPERWSVARPDDPSDNRTTDG